jgi:hypothetical protein
MKSGIPFLADLALRLAKGKSRPLARAILILLLVTIGPGPQAEAQGSSVAGPTMLSVEAKGELPGFRAQDVPQYLANQMTAAGVKNWTFAAPRAPDGRSPDRVEWLFRPDPYAGGGIRQFFPMPSVRRLFGERHLISVEVRLYLAGQYQTLSFGQMTIQGSAQDLVLGAFIHQTTQNLLGEKGAYNAIDSSPARGRDSNP